MDLLILNFLNGLVGHYGFSENIVVFFATYFSYFLFFSFFIYLIFSKAISRVNKKTLALVSLFSAFISRFLIADAIRFFYHRPRPFLVHSVNQLIEKTSYSFPSGHAMFIFAFAAAVYAYSRKWGITFFITGAITGVARIMAGVHYPSDILGGFLIGSLVGMGVSYILIKTKPSKMGFDK